MTKQHEEFARIHEEMRTAIHTALLGVPLGELVTEVGVNLSWGHFQNEKGVKSLTPIEFRAFVNTVRLRDDGITVERSYYADSAGLHQTNETFSKW